MPTQKQLINVLEQALKPFQGFNTGNPDWVVEGRKLLAEAKPEQTLDLNTPSPEAAKVLFEKANAAACTAAQNWLDQAIRRGPAFAVHSADLATGRPIGSALGHLLDLCGNAHVQFRKKNSKWYNAFMKAGLVRKTGNGVVEFYWKHKDRQEHGLQYAAAVAASNVLKAHGIDVRIWDYID